MRLILIILMMYAGSAIARPADDNISGHPHGGAQFNGAGVLDPEASGEVNPEANCPFAANNEEVSTDIVADGETIKSETSEIIQ